jgi:hypothetical protein
VPIPPQPIPPQPVPLFHHMSSNSFCQFGIWPAPSASTKSQCRHRDLRPLFFGRPGGRSPRVHQFQLIRGDGGEDPGEHPQQHAGLDVLPRSFVRREVLALLGQVERAPVRCVARGFSLNPPIGEVVRRVVARECPCGAGELDLRRFDSTGWEDASDRGKHSIRSMQCSMTRTLIGSAGLVPVMRLSERAGLLDPLGQRLSVPSPQRRWQGGVCGRGDGRRGGLDRRP